LKKNISSQYDSILKPLGLSEYEIRVFTTLIENGPTNYRALVKESNVPTGRIYQVLANLGSKGFVEADVGTPRLFKAIEPKKAIIRRLRQIEEDYLDLENRIKDVLLNLQFEYSQKYNMGQGIITEIIVGFDKFKSAFREHLSKAEDEVIFSSSDLLSRPSLGETIKDLTAKGVSVTALSPNNRAINKVPNGLYNGLSSLGVTTDRIESNPTKFMVVDDRNVSLIIDSDEEEIFVHITGGPLCKALRDSLQRANGKVVH
jgi:sugar-specific transcriptional regulator TrmB